MLNRSCLCVVAALLLGGCQVQKLVEREVFGAYRPTTVPFTESRLQSLKHPPGFTVNVFAKLSNPRMIVVTPNGTVYVSQPGEGKVTMLRDVQGDGVSDNEIDVITGKSRIHGLALHGDKLYMATVDEIFAAPILRGGKLGPIQMIWDDLPAGGQHPNRTMAFGPDSMLYVSIGSTCNNCIEDDPLHATIVRMKPDGTEREIFAKGLRNTLGFGWHPVTKEMWGMDHGSDNRGDDTPGEELNKLVANAHYGWPHCYNMQDIDPEAPAPAGLPREDFCDETIAPSLLYQAHSAPIGFQFYNSWVYPEEYKGDAFIAMRGSWNRSKPTGYKIVRVEFQDGKPVGFHDFVTSWLVEGDAAHFGRLSGLAIGRDGSILVADDKNGIIYRIAYLPEQTK